jgi:hypothetical protein
MSDEIIELSGIRGGDMYSSPRYAAPAYARVIRAPKVAGITLPDWLTQIPEYKEQTIHMKEVVDKAEKLIARAYSLGTRTRPDGTTISLTDEILRAMEEQSFIRRTKAIKEALLTGEIDSRTITRTAQVEEDIPTFEGLVSGLEAGMEPSIIVQKVIERVETVDTLKTVGMVALVGIGLAAGTVLVVHLVS